jgi:hypothetical protein
MMRGSLLELRQVKQLRDLNVQLLETTIQTLSYIDEYCASHSIPLPTENRISCLIRQTINLIEEINEEINLPPNLQHRKRTPSRETEPAKEIYFSLFIYR